MKKILNDSHDAVNIHDKSNAINKLERRISYLLSKKYTEKNCIRFVKRLKREQGMLFTFLKTGTDSHNNAAERAIRPNVVIRKITNGHRTDDGANSHKILMSIKETCRQRDLNFNDCMIQYLGNDTSKL
ncbi:MAG: Transposase [Cenarchaeum symbiont of Oopsacas minuta]|nr:Transposase [Cenarchaeum symbiont of Oopsacas minuta]MDI1495873.1 Transposase [Cenarchaeum symbiont of Oopsacas minuta]